MAVRMVPRAVLAASAAQFHAARFKDVPEPVVINLDAVLTIGQTREFQWGAIKLHAPPLSFPLGARLMVAANALRDLREHKAPPTSLKHAQSVAAAYIRQAVAPATFAGRLRCWSCLFVKDDPETVEGLMRWLLMVPDQAQYQPPDRKLTVDFMDAISAFATAFPAWMGADGWPLSWAHYQYGTRHLGRAAARAELRQAVAARAGGAEAKGFKQYVAEQQQAAGW